MALTPQNSDAFFREVDDELRRSRLDSFGRRWGLWLIVALVVLLAAIGGWLWYRHEQTRQAGVAAEKLSLALDQLSKNQATQAKPALTALAKEGADKGYGVSARLALADVALDEGDAKAAAAAFKAVADDAALSKPYRELALVRQTAAEFDAIPPAEVIKRLSPFAVAGNPWLGSAGEMVAMAHLKMSHPDRAAAMFALIARDEGVPGTLRNRATQMASAFGLDVGIPGSTPAGGDKQ